MLASRLTRKALKRNIADEQATLRRLGFTG
jgi:hypothetical protein